MYTNNIYKAAEEKDLFSARQLINSEKISTDEIKDRIESFLSNPNEVLNRISPSFLRKNESVIIASLQRNIDSIRCVDPEYINEHILEVAITEAIKQDYVIDAFTPTSMLENEEFVISCIERDINCVNFIRDGYLTPKIIDFATKQMLEKEYIIIQGKKIGIIKRNKEIALNMLDDNIPRKLISKYTELSLKELEKC